MFIHQMSCPPSLPCPRTLSSEVSSQGHPCHPAFLPLRLLRGAQAGVEHRKWGDHTPREAPGLCSAGEAPHRVLHPSGAGRPQPSPLLTPPCLTGPHRAPAPPWSPNLGEGVPSLPGQCLTPGHSHCSLKDQHVPFVPWPSLRPPLPCPPHPSWFLT